MKKLSGIVAILLLFAACSENVETPENNTVDETVTQNNTEEGPLEERAKRHVESTLEIPATEKYSLQIYEEHLDSDNKKDAIIAVNRMNFAIDEAVRSGNAAKRAEIGYMGNFNYIFFFDGGLNKISPAIPIPSTPQKELAVQFENITSEAYKDIMVDFRIRNAAYRDFFTVSNHSPRRIFQWKIFDGLGDTESEAFHFKYLEKEPGLNKDILVYKAIVMQPTGKQDLNIFEPSLKETEELMYRFFYSPQMGKYVTEKK
jgi:hypothetical protein